MITFNEERFTYKGSPPRSWFQITLQALDGTIEPLDVLADTGSPFFLIVSEDTMGRFKMNDGPAINTNFGPMKAGWLQVSIPLVREQLFVEGYSSEAVVGAAKQSSSDFEGLAGLPLLRLIQFGGNANFFWIKPSITP